MKVGDRVQFAFNNIRGAKGIVILCNDNATCLVEYTLSNGMTVLQTVPAANLVLIEEGE